MQVVILAGGRGTRAYPYTEYLPKPMMPVFGKPILVRVMEIFASQGHNDFVLSVGYRNEIIRDYFATPRRDWRIQIVDTGEETDTGGRIRRCRDLLQDEFFATYSDGLCDVDLARLCAFHRTHNGLVTVTSVPLVSQYGTIEADPAGCVMAFREKPVLHDHWINAGFFVMSQSAFDHWQGENLEREVLPALQRKGLLYAYRHRGFFKSLDTHKDQQELEQAFEGGRLPWSAPGVVEGAARR
ncbi:MAG TPA: sugar phosphate nucleotidyltransferase [Stellaceae bacterium]|jgi:glucose-1-phosphate cytidylyltransferase